MRISVDYRDGSKTLNDRHNPSNIVNKPCTATICLVQRINKRVGRSTSIYGLRAVFASTHRGDSAMASDDPKSDIEKRSGDDRRAASERRSGVDIRSEKEKRTIGERRANADRRSGVDRRASPICET